MKLSSVLSIVSLVALLTVSASAAKWECKSSCNIQLISAKSAPDRVTGIGTGKNEPEACKNAKRAATQKAPRGTYARHCQCKCKKK